MDAGGRVQGWNRAAERTFGYTAAEAHGRELAELIVPGALRDAHRNALARYLDTGESTIIDRRVEVVGMRRDGAELPVELTVTVLEPGNRPLFGGFIRPLGEREAGSSEAARMQKRMAFLAQAGLVLDSSLELGQVLRRLAALTVPELAQLTVIDLVSESGAITTAVAAAKDPNHARAVEEVRRRHPLDTGSAHPVVSVLQTQRSQLLRSMSADFQRHIAQGDEHFALMRRLRYHSAIVVPLIARQRVLGALSLLRMEGAVTFDDDDLTLAEDLGRRAALAIDNARLFAATREVARTLQESLLPRALPSLEGVRLAARYRAAAEGQEVGGDFYDAFAIDGARWGVAIGDVRGKGPRAAALTALARYTIRALCDRGAAAVLGLLNDSVVRDAQRLPERLLTAAVAVGSAEGGDLVLELAAAGHPPPLILRADGTVEESHAGGLLLGVSPRVTYVSEYLRLEPGDTLVLYTDGLTDARAPAHIITEQELAGLLGQAQGLAAGELASFLEDSVIGDGRARDDIALLVVQNSGREDRPELVALTTDDVA